MVSILVDAISGAYRDVSTTGVAVDSSVLMSEGISSGGFSVDMVDEFVGALQEFTMKVAQKNIEMYMFFLNFIISTPNK